MQLYQTVAEKSQIQQIEIITAASNVKTSNIASNLWQNGTVSMDSGKKLLAKWLALAYVCNNLWLINWCICESLFA